MSNHVVIMAGGIGSRFWPLSTKEYPKQFIDILGCGKSLIQLTVDRFRGVCPEENIWVVTNAGYMDFIREQLPQIPQNHILAEPCARNTAPCIAWAVWCIKAEDPQANVVVAPSDAFVNDTEEFRKVIREALDYTAAHDAIVTVGIKPTRPETGYGYVETVVADSGGDDFPNAVQTASPGIIPVAQFREKPDCETAQKYLAAGNFLWNAGIFVWNVGAVTSVLQRYKPELAASMDRIIATGDVEGIFPSCEKISIDFAVMEPASVDGLVYTRPADFGWSDLGNWASLYERLPHDAEGNAVVGNARLYDCHDCIVHLEDAAQAAIQGLDGYIISGKGGRLLICRRSEEQNISKFSVI